MSESPGLCAFPSDLRDRAGLSVAWFLEGALASSRHLVGIEGLSFVLTGQIAARMPTSPGVVVASEG